MTAAANRREPAAVPEQCSVARALVQRSITWRMHEICQVLRSPYTASDQALELMEEFVACSWQLGFPICAPDREIQEQLAERGWLLREFFDPFPDPDPEELPNAT